MNAAGGHATPNNSTIDHHRRITWRLRRGFAATGAALLCISYLAYLSMSRSSSAARWYSHSYQVLAELNQLQADISIIDNGARGWAFEGDDSTRPDTTLALGDYHARLSNLRELTAENAVQRNRLERLAQVCEDWDRDYASPLLKQKSMAGSPARPVPAPKAVAMMAQSRVRLDRIQTLTAEIRNDEANRLDERNEELEFSRRSARRALFLAMLFAASLLTGLFILLDRSTGRVLAANERLQQEVEERAAAEERLRESESRLKALIENTVDNIWSVDRQYRLTNFNSLFSETLFRRTQEEVFIGMDLTRYFDGANSRWKDWYDRAFAGEHLRVEESFESEGRRVEHELSFCPIETVTEDGPLITGATIFSRDITERKKVDRMKNEFISTVSHELRTPLTSIRGSLGLLSGGAAGALPDAAKPLVDIALNNAERLVRLINDILDVEKIESGKIDFDLRPMELRPLVQAAIDGARGFGDEMDIRFELRNELPAGTRICADADRFLQVMDNLLSNAAKFSPKGDTVVITLTKHSSGIHVSVKDNGAGVPPQFHDRIFSRFAQADGSDTRPKGGTGLGLSIVRAIVEKLGGTVDFDRGGGPGCTFFFDLPEWHEAPSLAAPETDDARVLICEDDPDIAELLRLMLSGIGFEADVARDIHGARQLLHNGNHGPAPEDRRTYRAMTLDLNLPDGDGISFIRSLRADAATRDLPVIIVSATASVVRPKLEGDAVDVVDWLEKPIDTVRLQSAVQNAVSRTRSTAGHRPRVLHVEDDPDILKVAKEILKGDADLENATGMAAARAKLAGNVYDLVILDITLPDGDGLELLTQLKNAARPTPVVVFSASELSLQDARRAEAALVKSRTSNETLLRTIQSLISRN